MLLVRVTVRASGIHGLGVFADEPIASGTAVWRFTPGLDLELDPSVVDRQPPLQRERLLHYGYVDARLGRYVPCCDDARFLNDSSRPALVQDLSSVALGSIDGPTGVRLERHIFVAHKGDYYEIADGLPQHED